MRALDYLLVSTFGFGLEQYCHAKLPIDPWGRHTLWVLYMDEGSTWFAVVWYLQYHIIGRVLMVRDIFQREWNDVQLAVKHCGLTTVILLTTMVLNLCYGPWEGAAWFEKLKAGTVQYFGKEKAHSPLFSAFFPAMARDQGTSPLGGLHQQAKMLS
jgi:hypothetical protein